MSVSAGNQSTNKGDGGIASIERANTTSVNRSLDSTLKRQASSGKQARRMRKRIAHLASGASAHSRQLSLTVAERTRQEQ
jgi:CRISPR/Cas system CMR subunit Cmr4 (Cas7 group RAMP superfamily)